MKGWVPDRGWLAAAAAGQGLTAITMPSEAGAADRGWLAATAGEHIVAARSNTWACGKPRSWVPNRGLVAAAAGGQGLQTVTMTSEVDGMIDVSGSTLPASLELLSSTSMTSAVPAMMGFAIV